MKLPDEVKVEGEVLHEASRVEKEYRKIFDDFQREMKDAYETNDAVALLRAMRWRDTRLRTLLSKEEEE